jgi:3-phosphoshikimate 1-carboxyvinyltransferase
MLSAGALGKGVCVRNLNVNSLQGDKRIIDVLRKFGAKITVFKDGYKVEKGNLNGIIYDCQNIPDLVQIISVVSAYASGKTTLKNVSRLTLKESDRIEGILNNLKACGIKAVYDGNDLTIYGGKVLGGDMNGSNDHRTVMSACILTAFASGCSTVTTPNAIKKSYPNFYKDFTLLGGKVDGDI